MNFAERTERLRQEYPAARIRSGKVSWWKVKLYCLIGISCVERYELRDADGRLREAGTWITYRKRG